MKLTKFFIIFFLVFMVTACSTTAASTPPPTQEIAIVIPTTTATVTPTLVPPLPTLMSKATPTETPISAAIPADMEHLLKHDMDDLAIYRHAMRPAFSNDVDMVTRAGASRYYLEINFDPNAGDSQEDITLTGLEHVRYTNTENSSLAEIYFRLYPNLPSYGGQMVIDTVMVDNRIIKTELAAEDSALRVPLPQLLAPGDTVDLQLRYTATLPTESLFGYNIFAYNDNTAALAGFYPVIAVYDEDGWDIKVPPYYGDASYLDIALYQVELTAPEEMVVAAAGSIIDRQPHADGTQTLSLVSGPIREFYIAMRQDYAIASETVNDITVNSYYPAELEEGGEAALHHAVDALRLYNDLFGPYPYAEFDIVATPTTAGGIEYPGIVVINQQLYEFGGPFFQQAIAHEVAHQWWYGVVGNDQVNEPWLDEAITNYSAIFYWEAVEADIVDQVIKGYFLDPYETIKEAGQDRAVVGPVSDFAERDYNIIVYSKGPLFFKALREEVGDDVYLKIMQTYYNKYRYQIATGDDLLAVIEQVSNKDVDPLFEQWMLKPETTRLSKSAQ